MSSSLSRMRVVIDARPLSNPQAGGFRSYVRSLVQGLSEISEKDEILLYLDRPLPSDSPPLPRNMDVRVLHRSRLRTDLHIFRKQVRRDRPDLVHGTVNYLPLGLSVPTTVTIHDALELKRYPFITLRRDLRSRLMRLYWSQLTRLSARKASRIVTISDASAAAIGETLNLPSQRFHVVYNGISLPAPGDSAPRVDNRVLAISSPDRRKNLDVLFRALSEHRDRFAGQTPELHVICTSASSAAYAEDAVARYGVPQTTLLRDMDDAAMSACFAQATVFVWPSLLEGFGLPPLEAMAMGCPVLSSCAPAMPEILDDAPLYFDPTHADQLADQLAKFLQDSQLRRAASEKGRARAAQFTCRRMAEGTRDAWRSVVGEVR